LSNEPLDLLNSAGAFSLKFDLKNVAASSTRAFASTFELDAYDETIRPDTNATVEITTTNSS